MSPYVNSIYMDSEKGRSRVGCASFGSDTVLWHENPPGYVRIASSDMFRKLAAVGRHFSPPDFGDLFLKEMKFRDIRPDMEYGIGTSRIAVVRESFPTEKMMRKYGQMLRSMVNVRGLVDEPDPERQVNWGNTGFLAKIVQEGSVSEGDHVEMLGYYVPAIEELL